VNRKKDNELKIAFGEHVRKLRLARGKSMRGFADEADIEYSQIARIEKGEISPTIVTAAKIADALEIALKDLFDFKIPKK